MIDVSEKFLTLRYARARGEIRASVQTLKRVREGTVPKGDVLQVARAAGIQAAKRTWEWMVFCHPIPLDWVEVSLHVDSDRIVAEAEVKAIWRTGVEMEALSAVSGTLLNIYDMLKPLDDRLSIGPIELLEKKGGKSDLREEFAQPLKTAVLVISDSTFAGKREDKSGKVIQEFLKDYPVKVDCYEVLPDEGERISARLQNLIDSEGYQLIFTTGGSGLGPRDVTPEATKSVIEKEVPGIAEAMRKFGLDRTPHAMLSRQIVGVRKKCLIVNLPGSSRGAKESLQALFPGVLHAFPMMWGGGHPK